MVTEIEKVIHSLKSLQNPSFGELMPIMETTAPFTKIEFYFTERQTGKVEVNGFTKELEVGRATTPHYRVLGPSIECCFDLFDTLDVRSPIPQCSDTLPDF